MSRSADRVRPQQPRAGQLGQLLTTVGRDFRRRTLAKLAAHGFDDIKASHGALLTNLGSTGSRLVDLAARAGITKQSMAAIADQLEECGYIERVQDPDDGRARIIRPSKRGAELIALWDSLRDVVAGEYASLAGAARLSRLTRDLTKLAAELELDPS